MRSCGDIFKHTQSVMSSISGDRIYPRFSIKGALIDRNGNQCMLVKEMIGSWVICVHYTGIFDCIIWQSSMTILHASNNAHQETIENRLSWNTSPLLVFGEPH